MPNEQADETGRIVIKNKLLEKGFVQIPVILLANKELSAGAKLVYGALLWYGWRNNGVFPGQETLAEDFGCGLRSVIRYMKELQDSGHVVVTRPGFGKTNTYTIEDLQSVCQIGTSRSANLASLEVPNWHTTPIKDVDSVLDSVLDLTESHSFVTSEAENPSPSPAVSHSSDSDILNTARETAKALDRPREARQLATWAVTNKIPPELLRSATEAVKRQLVDGKKLRKPVAYCQTVVKVMMQDVQERQSTQKLRKVDMRAAALAYARNIYVDPIIGGSWASVASIMNESYGQKLTAEVMAELSGEASDLARQPLK